MFLCVLFLSFSIPNIVFAMPSRSVPYFPYEYHPWDIGNARMQKDENKWAPFFLPEDDTKLGRFILSYDTALSDLKDEVATKESIKPSLPVYKKIKGGFVPPELSALDKIYWWDKRFNNVDVSPSDDIPYFDNDEEDNRIDVYNPGSVKKRDYTAAQLVNLLKALAKARRQRNVRIAGKALRFGISR